MLGKHKRREVLVAVNGVEQVKIHHQLAYTFVILAVVLAYEIALPRAVERYVDAKQLANVRDVALKRAPGNAAVAVTFVHPPVHVIKQIAT